MKKGVLSFHQDWTDILNRLPLINYYSTKYPDLTVILREEAKPIYEFYLRDKPHINKVYRSNIRGGSIINLNGYDETEFDYLLHDKFDCNRTDQYKDQYSSKDITLDHYNKLVYTCYDIDHNVMITHFEFLRDHELELETYKEFIKDHTSEYSLYHDNMLMDFNIDGTIFASDQFYTNLNGFTENPFSMIKVLMHSKELHVVDSFWASFCYLLDAKYNLLQNTKIYLYPRTPYNAWGGLLKDISYELKLEPISLPNWTIKN
jgi:hypothetical protein